LKRGSFSLFILKNLKL